MRFDDGQAGARPISPIVTLTAILRTMRPKQWSKNLIVFAPLVFNLTLDEPGAVFRAIGAFACFCAASSSTYLINDTLDRETDQAHPVKRNRPIASGLLRVQTAVAAAVALLGGSIAGAFLLRPAFAGIVVLYALLIITYSIAIKHLVIVDVFAIAGGFVLRAAGGAVALDIPISPWLYVCTVLLALFLALGKRRHELHLLESAAVDHRRNLDEYTIRFLDQLIMVTASVTVMAYSLYTFSAPNLPANHSMMLTIPFVLYGMFRYLYLVYSRGEGGAPDQLLVTDRPLLMTVVLWTITATGILYWP